MLDPLGPGGITVPLPGDYMLQATYNIVAPNLPLYAGILALLGGETATELREAANLKFPAFSKVFIFLCFQTAGCYPLLSYLILWIRLWAAGTGSLFALRSARPPANQTA